MPVEIERKYLIANNSWRDQVKKSHRFRQAYLTKNERLSIRVRLDGTDTATLTIKTAEPGIERNEYEYSIPVADAEALMQRRDGVLIAKVRHLVPIGDVTWEIDVFEGENAGLVVAEVELARADQVIDKPAWLGREVTLERRYYNANLSKQPYTMWADGRDSDG